VIGEFSLTLWLLMKGVKVQQTAPQWRPADSKTP
jgi:hypothetical protein